VHQPGCGTFANWVLNPWPVNLGTGASLSL
jgi:hypothetical protein